MKTVASPSSARVRAALVSLRRAASAKYRAGLARYGIDAPTAYGVPMNRIHALARRLGKDHDLAQGLWKTGIYEARLLAAFVEDPARVTARQMDAWARDFDDWAVCDTACFHLFDRTPLGKDVLRDLTRPVVLSGLGIR
jgi:3-methyladenine DNA glycosylase AlkD